jgi:hypothetical protein
MAQALSNFGIVWDTLPPDAQARFVSFAWRMAPKAATTRAQSQTPDKMRNDRLHSERVEEPTFE